MGNLRVHSLSLLGGDRSIEFTPDFAIVRGPISSGKSTALRLLRALLGRVPGHLPPETGNIRSLRARLSFDGEVWMIDRPLVTTKNASVTLSQRQPGFEGETEERITDALRLPAEQSSATQDTTYLRWLMQKARIPETSVPRARTDLLSERTPVTINDWLLYCIVRDSEIDTSVFGSTDTFKDRKRRAVFEINYGLYDPVRAELEATSRSVELRLADLDRSADTIREFLEGTPFGKSTEHLDKQITEAAERLEILDARSAAVAATGHHESSSTKARRNLADAEIELDGNDRALGAAERSLKDLNDLHRSLSSQWDRLSRAIVAAEWLVDFDFVVCPRCGTPVDDSRTDPDHCYLCLQTPQQTPSTDGLIVEQERIGSQLAETLELIDLRTSEIGSRRSSRVQFEDRIAALNADVGRFTSAFLSANTERLVEAASERALLSAQLSQLRDYRELFLRYSDTASVRVELEEEYNDLVEAIGRTAGPSDQVGSRLSALDDRFLEYARRLNVSLSDLPLTAHIDRHTYMPVVSGRHFNELSSQGLTVLVNVAHALAHHTVSLDQDLPLPGFLVLDGLSNNVGSEGFDLARRDDTYRLIIDEVNRYAGRLQVIALDNDVPTFALDHVVTTLTPQDRLIRLKAPPIDDDATSAQS
jgi:hypothetical protein